MSESARMHYRYLYTLPWPIPVNRMYRNANLTKLSARARVFKEAAGLALLQQRRPPEPLTGPVAVDLLLRRPDDRAGDVDNYAKSVMDALVAAGILADDRWRIVRSLSVTMADEPDDGAGCVVVDIRPLCQMCRRGRASCATLFDRVVNGDVPR